MQPLPMDAPAELRHRVEDAAAPTGESVRSVAHGSLVLMVHALCAVPAERRARCWIETAHGILDAEGAAALLRHWEAGVPIEDRV